MNMKTKPGFFFLYFQFLFFSFFFQDCQTMDMRVFSLFFPSPVCLVTEAPSLESLPKLRSVDVLWCV